jgi:hypothetical protein
MSARTLSTAERGSPPAPRHVAMSWARRLKRVFGVEIERCARCQGRLAITASIEAPAVIARILAVSRGLRWHQGPVDPIAGASDKTRRSYAEIA